MTDSYTDAYSYTDIFGSAPFAIVTLDLKNTIRAWNPAAARMFGFAWNEAIGRKPNDLGIDPTGAWAAALAAENPSQHTRANCRRRDGSLFPAELSLVWASGPDGHPLGTHVFALDISERCETETKLRDAETRFRRVVEGAEQFALFSTDAQGRIDTWNTGAEKVFGYSDREILGENIAVIFTDEDCKSGTSDTELNLAREHGVSRDERWHKRKDGSLFWANGILTALRDDAGNLTGFVKAMRDDTRRKLAEDRFAEEKERLAAILESLIQGIIVTDTEGRISHINRSAEELTGWRREEAMNERLATVFPLTEADPAAGSHANDGGERMFRRAELKTRQGETRPVAFIDAPMRQGSASIGTVTVFRDITDEIKMEQSLLKAEKLSALGVLSAGIAHEFNNLLTGLFGNITLARLSLQPQDPALPPLNEAEAVFWRARELTHRFMTFAKGGRPVKKRGFVQQLLIDSVHLVLAGYSLRLQLDIPPDLWPVQFDEEQIRQAFTSVLLNAREAAPEGGRIEVGARNQSLAGHEVHGLLAGPYIGIVIRDTGPGISADVLPKVFDPFFSTKPGNTGLGLSTAHSIVLRHGGEIVIDSEPGRGTAVHIFLPAAEPPR